METDEKESEELIKEYNLLKQKYNLPEFEKLAEDFDIEKLSERQSSFLLREIRRTISEKLSAYMHLLETLMNPSSPPMFVFTILKNTTEAEKDSIKTLYKKLARLQIESMKLDTIYSEKGEANFIIKSSGEWEGMKQISYKLFEGFEEKFEENHDSKARGYFG